MIIVYFLCAAVSVMNSYLNVEQRTGVSRVENSVTRNPRSCWKCASMSRSKFTLLMRLVSLNVYIRPNTTSDAANMLFKHSISRFLFTIQLYNNISGLYYTTSTQFSHNYYHR